MHTRFPRVRPTTREQRRRAPMSFRPTLECLEERNLLDAGMTGFTVTNLVSDLQGVAANMDPNLINPWGFAESAQGLFEVALNGAGSAETINASGNVLGQPIVIPAPTGSPPGAVSAPNGVFLNTTSSFVMSQDKQPAEFIFSTEDGTIAAFNPQLNSQMAVLVHQATDGAVYKLLAEASNSAGNFLFATDFHNNKIDVFDSNFQQVTLGQGIWGTFTDPNEPAGYAPFGIKLVNVNGQDVLFVSYAKQDDQGHDDVAGAGNGFISEFTTTGQFIQRFATGSAVGGTAPLDSPIGMTVAPAGFGPNGTFGGALLVGNFGDSHVSAFNLQTGQFLGQLSDANGNPLVLTGGVVNSSDPSDTKGLWGIAFGNGQGGTNPNALYFASGPNDENDGVFGSVQLVSTQPSPPPAPSPPTLGMLFQQVLTDLSQVVNQLVVDVAMFGPSSLNMPAMLLMSDPTLGQDLGRLFTDEVTLISTFEQMVIDQLFGNMAASPMGG